MRQFFERSPFNSNVGISVSISLLLCFAAHFAFGNWTSFRGNPQLTGVADSQLPDKPEVLWTFHIGDIIESTAAVVDGTVYVGALDGLLYVIDAKTGKKRWTYQANDSIKASPAIHEGVIYFGDSAGVFHAVDSTTQEKRWQFTTDGEIISSANFSGNRVLFGSYDGFLYCLNLQNGDLLWKFETEGYVHGTPGVWTRNKSARSPGDKAEGNTDNFVIVTGCDSYLRVINIADGTQAQQVDMGAYIGASPAILVDRIEHSKTRQVAPQPTSHVHAYCGTYGNEVLGVNLTSGKILWRYEHPVRKFPFFASAAITESVVIIGGRDKLVHALSPEKGEPQWTYTAKSRIESSPVIVGKRVFFGTTRGVFIALDIATGELVWEFATGSPIVASPSVADGRIYIGTEDGVLYCFGEKK